MNVTRCHKRIERGFTLLELLVVLTIFAVIAGIAIPQFMHVLYNSQLRSAAAEISDLTQQARIGAARTNPTAPYAIRFQMSGGLQQAYIDQNNNSSWDATEPLVEFPNSIVGASGAPTGSGGTPTAYTLVGDSSTGTPFDNSNVLAYSARGLPCNYTSGTCATPAASYFVFYFTDSRTNAWSAVLVTKSGRSKVLMWNGAAWQ